VEIVTLVDSKRFSEEGIRQNPFDLMYSLTTMARAHEESKSKSYRLGKAWNKKLDKAVVDKVPFSARCPDWLRLNTETKKFERIEDRIKVVRSIIALATSGHGHVKIAGKLNRGKIPAFGRKRGWSASTIRHLTTTRTLLGELRLSNGKTILHYYPAILTEQEFYAMRNSEMSRRHRQYGKRDRYVRNLFGKALVSGFDDSPMTIRRSPAGYRMVSIEALRGGSWSSYDYGTFERHFLHWVSEVTLNEVKPLDRSIELEGRLNEVRARIAKVKRSLVGSDFSVDLLDVLKTLTGQATTLEQQLEQARALRVASRPDPKNIATLLEKLSTAKSEEAEELRLQLRANIADLVKKVTVFIFPQPGKKPRLLIASAEMTDNTVRVFTCLAQVGKPVFSMGTKPIDPSQFQTEKIRKIIKVRATLDKQLGNGYGLVQLPRILGLPWDWIETPTETKPTRPVSK